jgi:colicin import membrane protein
VKKLLFIILSIVYQNILANSNIQNFDSRLTSTDATSLNTIPSALRKKEDLADQQKAEIKKIALKAKQDFSDKILSVWRVPVGTSGEKVIARVKLTDHGSIESMTVKASDSDVKASIEKAIQDAEPFPMPSNPIARRDSKNFIVSFTVK